MNDNPCVIDVNGTEYYYPCDKRDDIKLIDGYLINTSSSQITLYRSFPEYGDSSSGYPRIVMPSNTKAYYRSSYNSGSYSTLHVTSADFVSSQISNNFLLLVVLVGVGICQLFKR